jgi:drug/metabolite transporter (DMT)-like permease
VSARLAAVPGVILVALAAAMWGTDPIIRKPLSTSTSATTIVFGEHVVLVLLTLPLLLPALRAVFRAGWRDVVCVVVIGAGASAVATILFTEALFHGDFVTPVVIQKLQPLVAVAGAAVLLGERARPRFAWFILPALLGFWLVNQPHPLEPTAKGLVPIVEATAAAVMWALGTVLGRYVSRDLEFQHIVSLRFFFGLVASAIALPVMGAKAYAGAHDSLWIGYLAVVTGLLALSLYYVGLKKTPAMLSSIAELTYPAIAVVAGIYAYNSHLRWTQWLGVIVIIGTVTLLPFQRRRNVVAAPAGDAALVAT